MTWTTVESGPLLKMEILRTALDDAGIPCLIPDGTTKVVDPFVTGANSLDCHLQVPEERASEAYLLIEELRQEVALELEAEEDPEDEYTPAERRERAITDMGSRIVWGTIFIVTHPWALYYGYYYLRNTLGRKKPPGFVITVAALCCVVALWGAVAVAIVRLALLARGLELDQIL